MKGIPVILSSISDDGHRNYAIIVSMTPEMVNKTIIECNNEVWRTLPLTKMRIRVVTCIIRDSFPPICPN